MNREKSRLKGWGWIVLALALLAAALAFACGTAVGIWWAQSREAALKDRQELPEGTGANMPAGEEEVSPEEAGPGTEAADTMPPEERASVENMAQAILANMSLEEKVGQMFFVRCPEEGAVQAVSDYCLGGYILYARDFADETRESAAEKIQSYQAGAKVPMLIGVDEEGGTVNRVSCYAQYREQPFQSPQALYQLDGFAAVQADTVEKCQFLREIGINVNFAPVADVSVDSKDFMYARTFGQDAGATARYVKTVVEAMNGENVACVLKHFPGYGDNVDTHIGIAYDDRSYESFLTADFLPFQAGIDSGAGMVLVSHNIVSSMDGEHPASLSPRVHEILREELGFTGVIITDDLSMSGIQDFADTAQAAVLAVRAGNDLLLSTDFQAQLPAVLEAVREGDIAEGRIDESVLRILELKISLGLLEAPEE